MPEPRCNVAGLKTLLDREGAGCNILSIDCFDTLLWRRVAAPTDAFFLLARQPRFSALGLTAHARVRADRQCRDALKVMEKTAEVTLAEIYRHALRTASDEDIEALVSEELAVEKQVCFAFRPAVELIRQAKSRGMRVIVVSDTYFSAAQLRELIGSALGDEDSSLIDDIFVSSEYRKSKAKGLFELVLRNLKVAPESIIHIGDHWRADYRGAERFGLRAVHFDGFTSEVDELRRMALAAGNILLPASRNHAPAYQLCHAIWSEHTTSSDPHTLIGHMSLGPLMYAFVRSVADRALALKAAGKRPRLVFMLRDGWFPHRVYERLAAAEPALADIPHAAAELPRFAAYASSFTTEAGVRRYLTFLASRKRFDVLAQQLLLDERRTRSVTRGLDNRPDAVQVFCKRILSPKVFAEIRTAATAYRARMMRYVRDCIDAQPGETIVLVDLGYNGTVQSLVQPILEEELGVSVEGRYLLLRDSHETLKDMVGLIDRTNTDPRALDALLKPISLLEQLSKATIDTVIDYTREGKPVRLQSKRSAEQDAARVAIQQAALQFIDAVRDEAYAHLWRDPVAVHHTAVALLGRLLYLPSKADISVFRGFHTDINLGSDEKVEIFNAERADLGLRRRGLVYLNSADRPTLAMELRTKGVQMPLTYFTQARFGFELKAGDFNGNDSTLPVMIAKNGKFAVHDINVQTTHDGYHLALVGVDDLSADVGLMFGKCWSLIQIESITLVSVDRLMGRHDDADGFSLMDRLSLENANRIGQSLLQMRDRSGFVFVQIKGLGSSTPGLRYACAVVFRPLEGWSDAAAATQPVGPALAAVGAEPAAALPAPGKVTIPDRPASASATGLANGSICLLSCYLPNDPFVDAMLEMLDQRLASLGVTLIVLTTFLPKHDRYRYIQVPYLLSGYSTLAVPPDNQAVGRYPRGYLEADAHWQCVPAPHAHTVRGLAVCDPFYRRVLETLEPDCVFIWNPTVPAGRLLQSLCTTYTIPVYGIERGVYPNTMMIDHLGIGAMGDLNLDLAVRQHASRAPAKPDVLQAIRDHYGAQSAGKYAAKHAEADPDELRRRNHIPADRRIISFFLSAAAANWSPRSMHSARYSSPWFADAAAALEALLAATPEDVHILVQDHPLNRKSTRLPSHPRLSVCEGEPIRSMIGASELTAILGATTVQHEALLMDAPVLLLSRSQLSGKQVCYEYDGGDLSGLVHRALAREEWEQKREAIASYVPFLFEHVLLGLPDGPARTTVDDLAGHIAAMATPHATSIGDRVVALMEQIDGQAKVA